MQCPPLPGTQRALKVSRDINKSRRVTGIYGQARGVSAGDGNSTWGGGGPQVRSHGRSHGGNSTETFMSHY